MDDEEHPCAPYKKHCMHGIKTATNVDTGNPVYGIYLCCWCGSFADKVGDKLEFRFHGPYFTPVKTSPPSADTEQPK